MEMMLQTKTQFQINGMKEKMTKTQKKLGTVFRLKLKKRVTQAIVTENGEEKIIESGHKAEDDPRRCCKG